MNYINISKDVHGAVGRDTEVARTIVSELLASMVIPPHSRTYTGTIHHCTGGAMYTQNYGGENYAVTHYLNRDKTETNIEVGIYYE